MAHYRTSLVLVVMCVLGLGACTQVRPPGGSKAETTAQDVNDDLAPAKTPSPTSTPDVTTGALSSLPAATATPNSVSTATAIPTAAPTNVSTATAIPTATPTHVSAATAIPTTAPTNVSTATAIPTTAPTKTPVPTAVPTKTPVPTAVPTSAAAQYFPLIEYIDIDAINDAAYDAMAADYAKNRFFPTKALGLALTASSGGTSLVPLYRCMGSRSAIMPGWLFSFYATETSCAGNPFDNSVVQSITQVGNIYSPSLASSSQAGKVALYRYWIRKNNIRTPVLSTVTPWSPFLAIMRYETDATLGTQPLGYLVKMDSSLDGNQRWISGYPQNLCYGIAKYQTTCPPASGSLTWKVHDLRSATEILSKSSGTSGKVELTSAEIEALVSQQKTHAHWPLLVTVTLGDAVIAAKNARVVRTPFIAQYEPQTNLGTDTSALAVARRFMANPTTALLMGNQMIAHTAFTDPYTMRIFDPALFDGIVHHAYADPHTWLRVGDAEIGQAQYESFKSLDDQSVLVGAEFTGKLYERVGYIYPFDSSKQDTATGTALDTKYAAMTAESLDTSTGLFYKRLPSKSDFYLDLTTPAAIDWLKAGADTYLKRLYSKGVPIAMVSFSENLLQAGDVTATQNFSRLPYNDSPTFSESSYLSFLAWMKSVGLSTSQYWGLPVLPEHYAKAQAAGNPNLWRIQSAPAGDGLWYYWTIWRRSVFNTALVALVKQLKTTHSQNTYVRSSLIIDFYNWLDWASINGKRFDTTTKGYIDEYLYDPAKNMVYVDDGMDYDYANRFSEGAIDYFVHEIKWVGDSFAVAEAQRLLAFKNSSAHPIRTGIHVEIEGPYISENSNYMHTNMSQVFPSGYTSPAHGMVWAWEGSCEYVLSMKSPDNVDNENLAVIIANWAFTVTAWGNYRPLYDTYYGAVPEYCLYRHEHYNLGKTCPNGTCQDRIPMSYLRDNMRRLIDWRFNYLAYQ